MANLDDLPADQRAVLALLLKQSQSYEGIADLLDLEPETIRARAHAAVDALGPQGGRRLAAARRAELADFLLGQQDEDDTDTTRSYLSRSAAGRAWARVVAGELRPIGADRLPELPDEGSSTRARSEAADEKPHAGARRARATARTDDDDHPEQAEGAEDVEEAERRPRRPRRAKATEDDGPAERSRRRSPVNTPADEDEPAEPAPRRRRAAKAVAPAGAEEPELERDEDDERDEEGEPAGARGSVRAGAARPSSRRGGALLIGGLALLVVGLLAWLIFKGDGDDDKDAKAGQTSSTATQAQQPQPIAQVNLKGAGKSLGVAQILRSGTQTAVAIVGQDLPASTNKDAYAVWLYTSPARAKRLGYAPPVTRNGRLQGVATLPADARNYKELVVTREDAAGQSTTTATRPGPIVLRGSLKLPAR